MAPTVNEGRKATKSRSRGTEVASSAEDISSEKGTNDLIAYLVARFIVVLLVVMCAEAMVILLESLAMPALVGAIMGSQPIPIQQTEPQTTTSLFSLLSWTFSLVATLLSKDYFRTIGAARSSLTILAIVAMLLLLMLPLLLGALAFSRVVVRKMRALQELRERELVQIDQRRNQFMTDIAHDLRTPLMAISGMAHAISDGVVRDDAMRDDYLRSICDKADKMGGLVSSVFDYTKLAGGAFVLERETIDLPQLLLNEAAVVYTDIEDAGMHFSVQVPEEPCAVYADKVQLARVVANLLVNAMRHNVAGTEIALMMVRQAGVAYAIVADTGEPIARNTEELFQPFMRGDVARSASGGSGLGLSICKRIADLHGYELSLVQPYGRFAKAFVLRCVVE